MERQRCHKKIRKKNMKILSLSTNFILMDVKMDRKQFWKGVIENIDQSNWRSISHCLVGEPGTYYMVHLIHENKTCGEVAEAH